MFFLKYSGLNDWEIAANDATFRWLAIFQLTVTTTHGNIIVTLHRFLCCTSIKLGDLQERYNSRTLGVIQLCSIFKHHTFTLQFQLSNIKLCRPSWYNPDDRAMAQSGLYFYRLWVASAYCTKVFSGRMESIIACGLTWKCRLTSVLLLSIHVW